MNDYVVICQAHGLHVRNVNVNLQMCNSLINAGIVAEIVNTHLRITSVSGVAGSGASC